MLAMRFSCCLAALGFGLSAIQGCSSSSDDNLPLPAPPRGGSTSTAGGSAGSGNAGGTNQSGSGGTGGDSAGTGGSGGSGGSACATECTGGRHCDPDTVMCVCPANKVNVCADTCVNTQEDPAYCGNCETQCPASAPCNAGVCGAAPTEVAAASASCGVIRMAVSGTTLYFTEADTGLVRSVPVAGGAPTDVATDQNNPVSIAVDADGLYWANKGDGTADSSTVMKKPLPIDADDPIVLTTGTATDPDSPEINAIAVADETLYYTLVHDVHAISTDEEVSDDIVVGTATNLVPSGSPMGLALDPTYVVWTTGGERSAIEIDTRLEGPDGYLEVGDSQGDLVFADIATDGTSAYWATAANLKKRPLDISTDDETLATTHNFGPISAFTIDDTNVYFATDGFIYKAPLAGGVDPVFVLLDQAEPTALVVSGGTLYVATSDCFIRSVPIQ